MEEEKLVDGVKKLVILVNILLGKLKNIGVLSFSLLHKLSSLSDCNQLHLANDSDSIIMIHADEKLIKPMKAKKLLLQLFSVSSGSGGGGNAWAPLPLLKLVTKRWLLHGATSFVSHCPPSLGQISGSTNKAYFWCLYCNYH